MSNTQGNLRYKKIFCIISEKYMDKYFNVQTKENNAYKLQQPKAALSLRARSGNQASR